MFDIDTKILEMQKGEINEHFVYKKLAYLDKNENNKKILLKISDDELRHYEIWKKITKKEFKPSKFKILLYVFLARFFGLSFALKLMEGGEENAQKIYERVGVKYPVALTILQDEEIHERELIRILNDKRLSYAGAIVLGLNDALVELTGTLAGISLAFTNTTVVGITGLIMGIAASMSMAASSYLESKESSFHEDAGTNAITSSIYTGITYIITVIFLVIPYFIFENMSYALFTMLLITILIIAIYTFYISVAKELSFWKRFSEMAFISLGVTLISFAIGYLVKIYFGLDI